MEGNKELKEEVGWGKREKRNHWEAGKEHAGTRKVSQEKEKRKTRKVDRETRLLLPKKKGKTRWGRSLQKWGVWKRREKPPMGA